MPVLTTYEQQEIDRANNLRLQPVVFIHGHWLLSSSWDRWRALFEEQGYVTLAPSWPDGPATVKEANADPEVFAHKRIKQITQHYVKTIHQLNRKPTVIGHSFGGLVAQQLAGEGVSAVTVAIDPAGFCGVLPVPFSELSAGWPVLSALPLDSLGFGAYIPPVRRRRGSMSFLDPLECTEIANYNRAVSLTFEQFRFAFANMVDEDEAHDLYEIFAIPGTGPPLFQAATANLNPRTEDQVNTRNPARGPLLLIAGEKDHTVPVAAVNAAYKQQKRNPCVTEFREIPGRGHSLVIDHGWREVGEIALAFITQQLPQ